MIELRLRHALVIASAIASTGCGLLSPPAELDHDARAFMDLLRRDRLESAVARLRADRPPDTLIAILGQARDFLKPFRPESTMLVGWNVFYGQDTTGDLTYEAHQGKRTALVTFRVFRAGPRASEIRAFHWQETAKPLAEANAFTLVGKTPAHYLFLLLAITAVLICVGGAIFAGVQRMGVLWILVSLIGVGAASINWTTGERMYNPFSVQLFGAGYVRRGETAPYIITWSVPLGTILMLVSWSQRRRRRRKEAQASAPAL